MIYTVTFNPSLDYIVTVDHFQAGEINRTTEELIFPGGKGINVSIVLRNLGNANTALGFVAGFTGREIERLLETMEVASDFITLSEGTSRINLKMRSDQETEINGRGPVISEEAITLLYRKLDCLKEGDVLVLSGIIPSSMPDTIYMDIMKYLDGRGIEIAVDATRDLLTRVLPCHPFLIKPNNLELGELFHEVITDKQDVVNAANRLRAMGACNVLVSLAGEGAVLVTEQGQVYEASAPKGIVRNSVGAGDSMVAGFLSGYLRHQDYFEAFRYGVCAGSASAFSDRLATAEEVENLLANSGDCFRKL